MQKYLTLVNLSQDLKIDPKVVLTPLFLIVIYSTLRAVGDVHLLATLFDLIRVLTETVHTEGHGSGGRVGAPARVLT